MSYFELLPKDLLKYFLGFLDLKSLGRARIAHKIFNTCTVEHLLRSVYGDAVELAKVKHGMDHLLNLSDLSDLSDKSHLQTIIRWASVACIFNRADLMEKIIVSKKLCPSRINIGGHKIFRACDIDVFLGKNYSHLYLYINQSIIDIAAHMDSIDSIKRLYKMFKLVPTNYGPNICYYIKNNQIELLKHIYNEKGIELPKPCVCLKLVISSNSVNMLKFIESIGQKIVEQFYKNENQLKLIKSDSYRLFKYIFADASPKIKMFNNVADTAAEACINQPYIKRALLMLLNRRINVPMSRRGIRIIREFDEFRAQLSRR